MTKPEKKKSVIRKVLRWFFLVYVGLAAVIGTLVMAYPFFLIVYNNQAPAPLPVRLPNGFIYQPDEDRKYGVNEHITDENEKEIIASNVQKVMWHEDWVYGYRTGVAGEIYYFICKYGTDCSKSQNYTDLEFNSELAKNGLPEFSNWAAKSYDELLSDENKNGATIMSHGG